MTLCVSEQIVGSDIFDTPLVNIAGRDKAGGDQVAQPLRSVGVYFVVVCGHSSSEAPLKGKTTIEPNASGASLDCFGKISTWFALTPPVPDSKPQNAKWSVSILLTE